MKSIIVVAGSTGCDHQYYCYPVSTHPIQTMMDISNYYPLPIHRIFAAVIMMLSLLCASCSEEAPDPDWATYTTERHSIPSGRISDIGFGAGGVAVRSVEGEVGLLIGQYCEAITEDNTGTPISYNRLAADSRGNVWYVDWGGFGGVVRYRNGKLNFHLMQPAEQRVMDVTTWRDRVVVASEAGPLDFSNGNYSVMPATGWGTGGAITFDNQLGLWMASGDTLNRFDGTTWTIVATSDMPRSGFPSIACDSAGRVWYAVRGGPLYEFDGKALRTHSSITDTINGLAIGRGNELWVATHGGVHIYNGATWRRIVSGNGLPHNQGWSVAIDSTGAKWFGMDRKLSRYTGT